MKKLNNNVIKYFSYVINDNERMMAAIFGRKKILHEGAALQGYELCIQTAKDIIDEVLPTCPFPVSPRAILIKKRGPEFELYTIRPHPEKNLHGTVWYVGAQEYEYLRDYELIDCGMSEDIVAKAITDNGDLITVSTYGLDKNVNNITKVVEVDYRRPEILKKEKIKNAIMLRKMYIERMKIK
ncbi:MAG: hypothetical protein Q8N98_01020 [bacterium]|nr:hypothetical protein [bacterium]